MSLVARTLARREFLRAGAATWLGGLALSDLLRAVPASAAQRRRFKVPAATPSSPDDLAYLTLAEAATLIESRTVTPTDLVEACLGRVHTFEPQIKAFITLLSDEALAQARAATERIARQGQRTPLDGIPIVHKDLYDMAGVRTTAGSKVRAQEPPAKTDATVVARLRAAGAIVLGKVNTHEFAYGVSTPPTSNPWDQMRIPGGSSGGSAAAIASGFALGSTGTDTGGSIRIPSSLCNAVGIKPTYGRVSRAGIVPLSWSLDNAGPIMRSVEDCALMLNSIAGRDPRDPTTAAAPVPDFTSELGSLDVSGIRIGVPTTIFFDGADPETKALTLAAAKQLASLGATVVDLEMPASQSVALTAYLIVQLVGPLAAHEYYLRRNPQDYTPQTQELFALGEAWHSQHYLRAQRIRTINIVEWVTGVFAKVDAVLTPATPRPAPDKTEAAATGVVDLVNYTSQFDFNGCPSISVPAGFTQAGLPVGAMLSARPFDEARLLALAYAYQQATKHNRARPPLKA